MSTKKCIFGIKVRIGNPKKLMLETKKRKI